VTLFIIYRPTKKKPNNNNQIHQSIAPPTNNLLHITTFIVVYKAQRNLKNKKKNPLYSQAKNHCSLVMTLLFFVKKNQSTKKTEVGKMGREC